MKRNEILLKLKAQINELNRLKKEYTYHSNINTVQKDLKNVYNCIKNGGNLSDIQKVCLYNFSAYLNVKIPCGISLKQYIQNISNNVEMAEGVRHHIVYVDYLYTKQIYI